MHLLWRRYARSGYAPAWLYALIGSAFVSLVAWALFERDWLVAAIAGVMVAVTAGGGVAMGRMRDAYESASRGEERGRIERIEEEDGRTDGR